MAVVVFTGVLGWHRHGPLIGVAAILLGSIGSGGETGHAWLRARGVIRFDARKTRARRFGRGFVPVLAFAAVQWCVFVGISSASVLHDTQGLILIDVAFAILFCAFGLIMKLPRLARRSERIRTRRASREEELPELYNSGW
jgi:hypothetical protein